MHFALSFQTLIPKSIPKQNQFDRVKKLKDSGDVGDPQVKRKLSESIPPDHVKTEADFFARNQQGHVRDAAKELGFSIGKVWFVLRKVLKWRAYRPHTTTVLTMKHRQDRLSAAQWFLSHDS